MGGEQLYSVLLPLLVWIWMVHGATYSARVGTDTHVNEVASNFLSFSVDPQHLFTNNNKYNRNECICMASSLTPAHIRIAGPSTSTMTFHNASIVIHRNTEDMNVTTPENVLRVSNVQWKSFNEWAKTSGFQLVFALNPDEKTSTGMWDANSALSILTTAEESKLDDVVWQLGYECTNQSIEEYLNDLQTLRVIVETFPQASTGRWRVVGGDITPCLQAESKSDFKDYVTLSSHMLDAVLLNGNSSAYELEQMSDEERLKLLKLLSSSATPLWITDKTSVNLSEMDRAVDWIINLGYSARNGFAVHFRELTEDELYEPTLSFYMALLYKNLVGERVLNVELESSDNYEAYIFAHCTSLRHKPVPGAVTFYAANIGDEPARFSIKLTQTEAGGDIMQFILGHDHNGNIMVNGRVMYHEGDIKPIVKRLRPYKTLLVNLPPKSFGFWVLANTRIEACRDHVDVEKESHLEANTLTNYNENERIKRSFLTGNTKNDSIPDFTDYSEETVNFESGKDRESSITIKPQEDLMNRISDINKQFLRVLLQFNIVPKEQKTSTNIRSNRRKRQLYDMTSRNAGDNEMKKRNYLKWKQVQQQHPKMHLKPHRYSLLEKLMQLNAKLNSTRTQRMNTFRKRNNASKNKVTKRNSKYVPKLDESPIKENLKFQNEEEISEEKTRTRRSVDTIKYADKENEIDHTDHKVYKILHKINKSIKKVPNIIKIQNSNEDVNKSEQSDDYEDELVFKTKIRDNEGIIKVSDKFGHHGLLRSAIETMSSLLEEMKVKMSKVLDAVNVLD